MNSQKIFRIFGIDIRLHYSWYFVFLLLTWSLSTAYFPLKLPDQTSTAYWITGGIAALFLFASVLLHELSHSLVARIKKIKVESITLFFFGGVAGITKEDMKPSSEFVMAIAGPLFSLILAGVFYTFTIFSTNIYISAVTLYLFQLNLILAIFNLVPGYPLDGGRAFRAILYAYYKDLRKATRIAATGGKFVAGVLIFVGLLGIFSGSGNGLWFILLGGFLFFIANASYQQVVIRQTLSAIPVQELISNPAYLDPEMKFSDFITKYKNSSQDAFLVYNNRFTGILDLKRLTTIAPKLQSMMKLKQLSLSQSQFKSISIKDTAYHAFTTLGNTPLLPVMDGKKFVGIIERNAVINRLMAELKFSGGKHTTLVKRLRR